MWKQTTNVKYLSEWIRAVWSSQLHDSSDAGGGEGRVSLRAFGFAVPCS